MYKGSLSQLIVVLLIILSFNLRTVIWTIREGVRVGVEVMNQTYALLHDKDRLIKRDMVMREIQKESSIEWYREKRRTLEALKKAIENQDRHVEGQRNIFQNDGRFTKAQIDNILVEELRTIREIRFLYGGISREYNIAILRYAHGLQYRGVEVGLM